MKLKRWIDKRPIDMWVRDNKGVASKFIFGAKRRDNKSFVLPDYVIETKRVSIEWVKKHYGV